MLITKLEEFSTGFKHGKRVPVVLGFSMAGNDPVTVIDKLNLAGSPLCLLESGKGPAKQARYSFLGFRPHCFYRSRGNEIEIIRDGSSSLVTGDPYLLLQELVDTYRGTRVSGLPKFWGGAMGYFSYDIGRYFEKLPNLAENDLDVPESNFMFFDRVICFDHVDQEIKVIVTVNPADFNSAEQAYKKAAREAEQIRGAILTGGTGEEIVLNGFNRALQHRFQPECNVSKEEFEQMVTKAKEYIRAGDIFQVNLSLRLGKETSVEPYFMYKVLRKVNPSPYMSFIDFGDLHVVSSSPELLVKLSGDLAETRPIAGTRRRGTNPEEDLAMAHELISNEKERAEHVMLVDLERNDLGRVCRFGTVEVDELMVIEEYSHVMHIVSNVRGQLAENKSRFDLLKACFPGGTITGAPKIRSMEIIEELEPTRRGIYTGSIGFLGYAGEMETNIVIRTILMKEGKAYVQAGAGIVADSIPEREYYESMKKAEALLRAIEIAEEYHCSEGRLTKGGAIAHA